MLSELAVRRSVLTAMMMMALVVFGLLGLRELGISRYPEVEYPTLEIRTELPGADPEIIEGDVTDILEEAFNTTQGIRTITSQSQLGRSSITVEFELSRDIDVAAQDLRDKISEVRNQLPDDIEEPRLRKVNPNNFAFMWIAVRGFLPIQEVTLYAEDYIKPAIEKISGVGGVRVAGRRERTVRLWLDPAQLAGYALSVQDVIDAVQAKHVQLPGGTIETPTFEFALKTEGEVQSPDEFGEIVVAYREGAPITVGDLGVVEDGLEDNRGLARHNGKPSVGMGVELQPGANMVAVGDRVRGVIESLKETLPEEITTYYSTDQSVFVRQSIEELQFAVVLCGCLVIATVFLFLRNIPATLIIGLTLPISFIGTFGFMRMLNFSINEFTLLAMALAAGVIVDDAIVVLENVYRHRENGEKPIEAAVKGAREVFFPVVATTASLVSVFLPVAFLRGIIGRIFFEFGVTVAISVILSSFTALTLTPMLCAHLLRVGEKHNVLYRMTESGFRLGERGYQRVLGGALRLRWLVILLGFATAFFAYRLGGQVGSEMVPQNDEGLYMGMLRAPVGSSVQYTDKAMYEVEKLIVDMPETYGVVAITGLFGPVSRGMFFTRMVEKHERERSQMEVMSEVRKKANAIPGARVFTFPRRNIFSSGQAFPIQFSLLGPHLDVLGDVEERVRDRMAAEVPGVVDINSDLELNLPEVRANLDRDAAEDLGIEVRDIARMLQALVGGLDIATYKEGGQRYDVRIKLDERYRRDPSILNGMLVRNNRGDLVRLDAVADLEAGTGISVVNRYNRQRSVSITANLEPGFTQGEALEQIQRIANEELPVGYAVQLTGQSSMLGEAMDSLIFAMGLAVLCVYMVLASQFNSLLHPFTIMLALPLAAIGAVGALYLMENTFNVFSVIGLILLIGLVIKNSILLVDYARQAEMRGLSAHDAMQEAARIRFRPILMTAFTTILGMLPIAFGIGPGSETRVPMGVAAAGGMLSATFLTLVVVPALYTLFADVSKSRAAGAAWKVIRRFTAHDGTHSTAVQ